MDSPCCAVPLPTDLEHGSETTCPCCGQWLTIESTPIGLQAYTDPDSMDDPHMAASGGMRGSEAEDEMRERAREAQGLDRGAW